VITSSSAFISKDKRESAIASVPFATPTPNLTPQYSENSFSNFSNSSPRIN